MKSFLFVFSLQKHPHNPQQLYTGVEFFQSTIFFSFSRHLKGLKLIEHLGSSSCGSKSLGILLLCAHMKSQEIWLQISFPHSKHFGADTIYLVQPLQVTGKVFSVA